MPHAVIVSTARTPIGKAYRGAFNNTHGATMAGHVIGHAVQRAGVDPGEVEDVILGCALPEGATGQNIARQAALRGKHVAVLEPAAYGSCAVESATTPSRGQLAAAVNATIPPSDCPTTTTRCASCVRSARPSSTSSSQSLHRVRDKSRGCVPCPASLTPSTVCPRPARWSPRLRISSGMAVNP